MSGFASATDSPHVITYNGGTVTINVNQQVDGGKWNLLGEFDFATGTAQNVKITDAIATSGPVIMADAIRFVLVPPSTPPAAPSGLTATAVSSSRIDLSWTDNSTDESNFIVSRSTTAGGPYTDIATLGANVTSYSDTGLAASTTYFYVVRASNSGGSSAFSNEASATTQSPPLPPNAPSGLTATAASTSQINLSWADNSSNEDNFVVARSTTAGGPYTDIATLGANTTSYSNTGLAEGTTYYYVVRAVNAGGSSAYSNEASATTSTTPKMHVQSITMSWVASGKKYKARAVTKIVDASGAVVSGASVTGNFTGAISESNLSATTDSTGNATVTSTAAISRGTVTWTVTGVSKAGWTYDSAANVVTSASISR